LPPVVLLKSAPSPLAVIEEEDDAKLQEELALTQQ
jgi:hypothetical protein